MSFLHSVTGYLLWVSVCVLISETAPIDVTYDELERLNITCTHVNSCQNRRDTAFYDLTKGFSCHCGSFCSELGTCCVDSPFRDGNRTKDVATCRQVTGMYHPNYFIIDKCTSNANTNDAFQNLCEREQETEGDLMTRVPVTSVTSKLTYKNYFCFRCHETNAEYFTWNIEMTSDIPFENIQGKEIIPTYNKEKRTWLVPTGGDDALYPVEISIAIPRKVRQLLRTCFPGLISNCSDDWPEDEIREKCGTYMSVIRISDKNSVILYRNPHCALCNYKNLDKNVCEYYFPFPATSPPTSRPSTMSPPTPRPSTMSLPTSRPSTMFLPTAMWFPTTTTVTLPHGTTIQPFSFTFLLDINLSDGQRVGQFQRCDDSFTWDPYAKRCRKLFCNVPGYVIMDMKCVPP